VYLSYFNAGLRVFDVSQPRLPREVAWFLPPDQSAASVRNHRPILWSKAKMGWSTAEELIYVTDENQVCGSCRQIEPEICAARTVDEPTPPAYVDGQWLPT
jgi:hypothetical protein